MAFRAFFVLLVVNLLKIQPGSAQEDLAAQFQPGPFATETAFFDKDDILAIDHNIYVYGPSAPGTFPIIYFSSSLAGNVPATAYKVLLEHIASHGYVVVCPAKLNWPGTEYESQWLIDLHKWVESNLVINLINMGFDKGLKVDFSTEFVMGHSAGNHVMCEYLKATCGNVQGFIMMSPVDGVDELGIIKKFCIEPPSQVSFNVPTLVIPAGLDSVPGLEIPKGLTAPCAPEELSNRRFYDGMIGPTWMVNATGYGHADLLEPGLVDLVDELKYCAFHEGGDPDEVYRRFLGGSVVSFAKGIMGDCNLLQNIEDSANIPVDTQIEMKGMEVDCPLGSCEN